MKIKNKQMRDFFLKDLNYLVKFVLIQKVSLRKYDIPTSHLLKTTLTEFGRNNGQNKHEHNT